MSETIHPVADRLRSLARTLEERFISGAPLTIGDATDILLDLADAIDPPLAEPESVVARCPDCEGLFPVFLPDDGEAPSGIIQCSECGTFYDCPEIWEKLTASAAEPSAR